MKHSTLSLLLLSLCTLQAVQAQRPTRHLRPQPKEIISTRPQGELMENLNRTAHAFYLTEDNYAWENNVTGVRGTLIKGTDGCLYFYNPVAELQTQTWLKLEPLTGDTLVAHLPQDIYSEYYDVSDALEYLGVDHDTTLVYQLRRMTYGVDDYGDWYFPDPSGKTDIKFTFSGDTLRQVDERDVILGLADESGEWTGYGDYGIVLKRIPSEPFQPEDADWQEYMLDWVTNSESGNRLVTVAINGDEVYIDNLYEGLPEGVVRGTISADDVVTFPSRQYLGYDETFGRHVFFFGGRTYRTNDAWGESLDIFGFDEGISLKLDRTSGIFTALKDSTNFLVNAGDDFVFQYGCYTRPHLVPYQDKAYTPAAVTIDLDDYSAYDDVEGYGYVHFFIPTQDVNGNFIDANKLFYNLYINGKVLTFSPSNYAALYDDLTDVPYSLIDNYDFIGYDGGERIVYFYEDAVSVGIQMLYKGGGTTTRSKIAYINFDDLAVKAPTTSQAPASLFDLQGRRLQQAPRHGVYLQGTRKLLR